MVYFFFFWVQSEKSEMNLCCCPVLSESKCTLFFWRIVFCFGSYFVKKEKASFFHCCVLPKRTFLLSFVLFVCLLPRRCFCTQAALLGVQNTVCALWFHCHLCTQWAHSDSSGLLMCCSWLRLFRTVALAVLFFLRRGYSFTFPLLSRPTHSSFFFPSLFFCSFSCSALFFSARRFERG